jgi:hypothetical protein
LRNIFPISLNSEASNRFSFFLIHSKTEQSEAAQKQFLCRFVLPFFLFGHQTEVCPVTEHFTQIL